VIEALGEPMHHHLLEPAVMQNRRIDEGRELRLLAHHHLGLSPDARPDGVDLVEGVDGFGLLLAHRRLPARPPAGP
jgi:hypothetical protein